MSFLNCFAVKNKLFQQKYPQLCVFFFVRGCMEDLVEKVCLCMCVPDTSMWGHRYISQVICSL